MVSTPLPLPQTRLISVFLCLVMVKEMKFLNIIQTSPISTQITKESESSILHCETDAPWFFCLWNSPDDDRHCAIQESEPVSVCSGDPGLQLFGTKTSCSLHINSTFRNHHGDWLCLLSDIREFETVREQVHLTVGREADIRWNDEYREEELVLTDGEVTNLTCVGERGLPGPTFSWLGTVNLTHLPQQEEGRVVEEGGLHTAWQTVQYTASLQDSGLNITCIVDQVDSTGDLLYTSSITLQLIINPIIPKERTVGERLGVISGVLTAIILLCLLACILIVFIILRTRKHRKYRMVYDTVDPAWKERFYHKNILKRDSFNGDKSSYINFNRIASVPQLEPLVTIDRRLSLNGDQTEDLRFDIDRSDRDAADYYDRYRLPEVRVQAVSPLRRRSFDCTTGGLVGDGATAAAAEIHLPNGNYPVVCDVTPLMCDMSTYSKESPSYLDTTLDSGYVTKDGYQIHLDQTVDSDQTTSKTDTTDPEYSVIGHPHQAGDNPDRAVQDGQRDKLPTEDNPDNSSSSVRMMTALREKADDPLTGDDEDSERSVMPAATSLVGEAAASHLNLSTTVDSDLSSDNGCVVDNDASAMEKSSSSVYTIFDCELGCFVSVEEYNRRYGRTEEE